MDKVVIGDCTLYHGDCREYSGPVTDVDSIITDPVWPNCPNGLLVGADGGQQKLLKQALEIFDAVTVVIILGFSSDPRFLQAVPKHMNFIRSQQLPYAIPGYFGRLLGGDEMAYAFGSIPKGTGTIPGRCRCPAGAKIDRITGHPCPRADSHIEQLVGWWSPDGGLVADPFMGSGSCGVACASARRRFIGFEIERKYFDIACKRIEQAYAQQRLFA